MLLTNLENELKEIAVKTLDGCTFLKNVSYFNKNANMKILLPSADEKYISFWVRDCAMMAESNLIPNELLGNYIRIIASHGQNTRGEVRLENDLIIPCYAIADHINYDGNAVFFPGTYDSGNNQGNGNYGYYPPLCDNYYYIIMVSSYVKQSKDTDILNEKYGSLTIGESLELAFSGYNIDEKSDLCISDAGKYTVDWGFADSIRKNGKLLMPSLLRYKASKELQQLFKYNPKKCSFYKIKEENIKRHIISELYDEKTGWFFSSTGLGKQYDVWATAYAVFLDLTESPKTLEALYRAYENQTAVSDGYVRHILITDDYSSNTAWECAGCEFNTYQNGGYWATPVGWYAYALYLYNTSTKILEDFVWHTRKYEKLGAPFEWINQTTTNYSGLNYGTSGVLPYIGMLKIQAAL